MAIGAIGAEVLGALAMAVTQQGGAGAVKKTNEASEGNTASRFLPSNTSAAEQGGNMAKSGSDSSSNIAGGRVHHADGTRNDGNSAGIQNSGRIGYSQNSDMQGVGRTERGRFDRNECQSCKNRKYQDGSNDPGVSFKAPTKISADQAASAVMGHEMEHVNRNQAKAQQEGREVLSSSVVLHSAICPECGKSYISGGETRTVTGSRVKKNAYEVGQSEQGGKRLEAVA